MYVMLISLKCSIRNFKIIVNWLSFDPNHKLKWKNQPIIYKQKSKLKVAVRKIYAKRN
jgi:hypothetical protein